MPPANAGVYFPSRIEPPVVHPHNDPTSVCHTRNFCSQYEYGGLYTVIYYSDVVCLPSKVSFRDQQHDLRPFWHESLFLYVVLSFTHHLFILS